MSKLTLDNDEHLVAWKAKIDAMSLEDMARLWRFAPSGHPCFVSDTAVCRYFATRFEQLGGWSPELSKKIGWDK